MSVLCDENGASVEPGAWIDGGGEGEVFAVKGSPDIVFKRYINPVSPEQAAKLRAMVSIKDAALLAISAWPTGIVTDGQGGPTVGFLMPNLQGYRKLLALYSGKQRKKYYPQADWGFLVHAARNTAAAFGAIHSHGCVVGDVNEENIVVDDRATVKLIDCDSMQVAIAGRQYLCPVARPFFVPPELQGASFRSQARTANHDLFGMAVLCFYLLFLGLHPFKGRPRGGGELKIEDAIGQCLFVYGPDAAQRSMRGAPGAPSFAMLPPEVSSLFEMAFGNGGKQHGRPVSDEWVRGFERLKKSLTVCGRDRGHRYPQGASDCPWCELERRGMSRIFPGAGGASGGTPGVTAPPAPPFSPPPVPPTAQAHGAAPRAPAGSTISMVRKRDEGRRAVERWWQKIEAIPLPKVTGLPTVPKTNTTPPPIPQKFARSALPSWMAGSIITALCVMSLLLGIPARESMGLWAVGGVFVTTGGTSWLLLLLSHDGYREEWRKWKRRLRNAERRLKWSRKQWNGLAANQTVSDKKEELRRLYRKYQQGKAAAPAGYATAEEIRDLEELVNRLRKGEQSLQVMARHFEAVRKRVATEYVGAATEAKQATACLRRLSTISP